jgi:hypothetical protein
MALPFFSKPARHLLRGRVDCLCRTLRSRHLIGTNQYNMRMVLPPSEWRGGGGSAWRFVERSSRRCLRPVPVTAYRALATLR